MPELKIQIRYIALLHHHPKGLIVLFPSQQHELFVDHPDRPCQPVRQAGDIRLLHRGEPQADASVSAEDPDRLIHLDHVAGKKVAIQRHLLASAFPSELNARLFLRGGKITALDPHADPQFKGRRWRITPSYNPVLTDTLEYSVPVDDLQGWQLEVPSMGLVDLSDGQRVTLANEDSHFGSSEYGARIDLEEVAHLYQLSDDPGKGSWPYPSLDNPPPTPNPAPTGCTQRRAIAASASRPMCTPAQSEDI